MKIAQISLQMRLLETDKKRIHKKKSYHWQEQGVMQVDGHEMIFRRKDTSSGRMRRIEGKIAVHGV